MFGWSVFLVLIGVKVRSSILSQMLSQHAPVVWSSWANRTKGVWTFVKHVPYLNSGTEASGGLEPAGGVFRAGHHVKDGMAPGEVAMIMRARFSCSSQLLECTSKVRLVSK